MLYNCGCCGYSINISMRTFLKSTPNDLDDMCTENELQGVISDPFYDSVMEIGEAQRRDVDAIVNPGDDQIEIDEGPMDIPYYDEMML